MSGLTPVQAAAGGGGGGAPTTSTYVTTTNQVASLPNSHQLSGDVTTDAVGAATLQATAAVEAVIRANSPNQLAPLTGNLAFAGFRATGLADGTAAGDAASVKQAGGYIFDANIWTRTGNTTFTLSVDATGYLKPGTKLTWKETGTTKYGVVATAVFAAGTTTVTMIATTDYVMAATPDAGTNAYAYKSPFGFPSTFAFTPTFGGFSAAPGAGAWWSITDEGLVKVTVLCLSNGTSNATTLTVTAPIGSGPNGASISLAYGVDNGTATMANANISSNASTITCNKQPGTLAWTNTGAKSCSFTLIYGL